MRRAEPDRAEKSAPGVEVWDAQYCAPSEAYTSFADEMRASGLPFTAKQIDGMSFRARHEMIWLDQGLLGRFKSVPTEFRRTKSDIAHSSSECFCAYYVLSGSMAFEQDDRRNLLGKGDLVFFDSALPVTFSCSASPSNSFAGIMGMRFPKALFSAITNPEDLFVSTHYPREKLLGPLASTLTYMSNRLVSASYAELNGLFNATIDLIPVSVCAYSNERDIPLQSTNAASLRAVSSFIEDHLTNSNLSAASTAKELLISASYVHRMFALTGMTFGAYVMAKRLDRVRADLISPICQRTPIADIAYKWGFNDLSTFNRSFKKRFGCTPRALRE